MGLFSKVKNVVKKAAPIIGTAVGTMYGGPVGGALGGALGSKVSGGSSFGTQAGEMLGGQTSASDTGGIWSTLGSAASSAFDFYNNNKQIFSSAMDLGTAFKLYDNQKRGLEQQNNSAKDIADAANQMSQSNAREQMAFQERMAGSAHQREIADLRAAGLNPILTATGGSGAAAPSGAQGSVTTAPVVNESTGMSSAVEILNTIAKTLNTKAETDFLQTAKTPNVYQDTALKAASARNISTSTQNLLAQNPVIKQQLQNLKTLQQNYEKSGKLTVAQTKQVKQVTANLAEQFKTLKTNGDISASDYGILMEKLQRAIGPVKTGAGIAGQLIK